MNTQEITEAILYLHKKAIFTVIGDEIDWLDETLAQPTKTEIENAHQALIASKTQAEAQKATDRAALLAKLGISEDEARLLLG
jgi:hypothetical protein